MNRFLRHLLTLLLALVVAACDFIESLAPPPDQQEVALSQTAIAATVQALQAAAAFTATPTPSPSPTTSATPTATYTPTPSPTPNPTQVAMAACLARIIAFTECVNEAVLAIVYPDGAPDHRIVNNADRNTLYRDPVTLEMLNAPGVTMLHNYFTRPDSCPLGTACVLHLVMFEFPGQPDALAFFKQVTQTGMEGETIVPAPNANVWDASKCATGTRPSSAAGAPPFAVVYCSVSLGPLHFGFNLSSYETLPAGFVPDGAGIILAQAHDFLSVWQPPAAGGAPVEIRWYTGLGAGGDPALAERVEQVAADFNASHPNINLVLDPNNFDVAYPNLASQIAAGNPPDIVGPFGLSGAAAFGDEWLDLTPLIESTGYDLSQYPPELVDLYRADDGSLVGLPFAVFPSALYYDRDLFDQAGLAYPPQTYDEQYVLPDGTRVEWNFDTVRKVALLLTVDANGNSANDPGFDSANIVQYGFDLPNPDLRAIGSYFGAGALVGADGQTAVIPAQWQEGWQWVYDGVWTDHFIANQAVRSSAAFGSGNPFNSGNVAMALTDLGYTCCLAGAGGSWDLAVVPAHNGATTASLDADTFYIVKDTPNPSQAFEVLTYLLGEASPELLELDGGLPARDTQRQVFLDWLNEQYPQGVDWQVAVDGLAFADNPSFAGDLPNYTQALERSNAFLTLMFTTPGLDLDAEIETLQTDLQTVFDQDP